MTQNIQTVTFDLNNLGLACRPEKSPNHRLQPRLGVVRDALVAKRIKGFFPVTILTLDGIRRADRARVYSGTTLRGRESNPEINVIKFDLVVEQPDRKPLAEAAAERIRQASAIGMRALKAVPRVGAFQIEDPDDIFYLHNGDSHVLKRWIDKCHEVAGAIESRGVGKAQLETLGQSMAAAGQTWYQGLENAKDVHQRNAVQRAFSEWADGDAIASHVAYGVDVFCSDDFGGSNGVKSVLDGDHRAWLTATFGVRFMTIEELVNALDAEEQAA